MKTLTPSFIHEWLLELLRPIVICNPEICQTGKGIVHEVCGIVLRAPSKDDINISEACKTGNRIIHFKMLFAALRTY